MLFTREPGESNEHHIIGWDQKIDRVDLKHEKQQRATRQDQVARVAARNNKEAVP